MTAPATLLALADRIEKEEPSRELDEAIVAATGLAFTSITMPPPFTSSLDAAVTLVPPNLRWKLVVGYITGPALAYIEDDHAGAVIDRGHSRSSLPALALCAAALRARAMEAA